MREIEFQRFLDEENLLRMRFTVDKGVVTRFAVQLECRFSHTTRWTPVIRFDAAHGFAHCDRLHPYKPATKIEMGLQDYNQALNAAMTDLTENWLRYRTRYETWLRRN